MQMWGAMAVARRGVLLLAAVAGLGVGGCLDPDGLSSTTSATSATSATTAGGMSSATTGEATSSSSSSTASGESTTAGGDLCPFGQIYRCDVDPDGECTETSTCVPAQDGLCDPATCEPAACDVRCGDDRICEPSGAPDVLRCVEDPALDDCDVWAQDCPPGYKCAATATGDDWSGAECFEVEEAPAMLGELCVAEGTHGGWDSCALGSMCWYVDPRTLEGVCVAQCSHTAEDPQCPATTGCKVVADSPLILCLPRCDPLATDACPNGQSCLPSPSAWGFLCEIDESRDNGLYGDPCVSSAHCDSGLACLNAAYVPDCEASGCCTPFCETTAENTCPGADQGQECIPWFEAGMTPEGYETLGVCGIPQ